MEGQDEVLQCEFIPGFHHDEAPLTLNDEKSCSEHRSLNFSHKKQLETWRCDMEKRKMIMIADSNSLAQYLLVYKDAPLN